MKIREIEDILYDYRKKCKKYDTILLQLCKLRYDMQGLKAQNYSKIIVQGGQQDSSLDRLIDTAIKLEEKIQDALIEKTTAYTVATRLIFMLSNSDHLCDILIDFFLLGHTISDISKRYYYQKQTCYNKLNIAKKLLARITEEKGITKETLENFDHSICWT